MGKKIGVFPLKKKQIEREIAELKMEYVNLQGDIEKLESVGQNSIRRKIRSTSRSNGRKACDVE